MAYDEHLAERVRQFLPDEGVVGKQMFGGLAFLLNGNMSVGVLGEELIVRLGAEEGARALAEPHVRVMDFTGRPMKGWVIVGPAATADDGALAGWVERGIAFAASLPPK
jgi:TfoX/Sxy family transcriptional regulator of competence genes